MTDQIPLDPQVAAILERMRAANRPPLWELTPDEARQSFAIGSAILDIPTRPLHRVDDVHVPVAGRGILVRLYYPRQAAPKETLPAVVWIHGGGFTIGSVATYDALCRMLSERADCIVASVDYRLAPEHKFPGPLEDCYAALQWVYREAEKLGIDPTRIAIAGDSAGGNLSAVCAIRARDHALPLALQILVYPGTNGGRETASRKAYGVLPFLDTQTIGWFEGNYLRSPQDIHDWRLAPLITPRLTGVAPAWIGLAECDPLTDEGIAYAERLRAERVRVEVVTYPGMCHGFFNMGRFVDAARRAHDDAVAALKQAFGTSLTG